ncbi:kinase-like domain-containing protein [Syncephalis plumigaleata]|nr:kinase-like domain-containing protein [Syncephalis plumigaleata]
MFFIRKSFYTCLIGGLIATAAIELVTGLPLQGTKTLEAKKSTHFLNQELDQPNTFGQYGLKIKEVLVKHPMMKLAKSDYSNEHLPVPPNTVVKCVKYHLKDPKEVLLAKHLITTEKEALRILKASEAVFHGPMASGRQFVVRGVHQFDYKGHYCFVLSSGGDETLLEYTHNMTLAQKITFLPRLLKQVMQGVAYMHRMGLAHNDIKPDNIMVNATYPYYPRAKIIDLDTASPLTYTNVMTVKYVTRLSGTPKYFAPECHMRIPFDPVKKDMWAIGATFYRVLFGKPLFPLNSNAKLKSALAAAYTNGLDASLFKMDDVELQGIEGDKGMKQKLELLISRIRFMLTTRIEDRPVPIDYVKTFI